jgi:MFS family permease
MCNSRSVSASADHREPLGPTFRRLWVSAGLSNLADGTFKVALPLIAVQYTKSPTLIAGLAFALTLPWLLFALHAGAIADRFDRRRLMLVANLARAGLVAVLVPAVLFGLGSVFALYVIAFGIGVAETVYDTSAQTILPQLVPRERLSLANGRLYAAELTANQFLGPPLGGLLVGVGAAVAFATPVALWLVAVGALLLVRGRFRVARTQPSTLTSEIAEGVRFLWRNRVLRSLAAVTGVYNLATSATFAVLVLFAVGPGSPMGLTDPAYGLLLTTLAAGSLLGTFVAGWIERRLGRARSLRLGVLSGAGVVGIPAVTTNPFVIGAVFVIGGISVVVVNIVTVSLRQRITPDRLLGRVNSGYRLVGWGTMPLGAALGGGLAGLFGLRAVFSVMAMLVFAVLAGMSRLTDRAMDAAEVYG